MSVPATLVKMEDYVLMVLVRSLASVMKGLQESDVTLTQVIPFIRAMYQIFF